MISTKKRKIYIALIICLLLLNYNNYIWLYKKLYKITYEQYIKHQIRDETIVVSLSTTPYRINALQPILQNIIAQNVNISKIFLNIPYHFKRDNLEYHIPNWLVQEKRVTIVRTNDYGPATKLLPALEQTNLSPETIIITLDDDIQYPNNLVLHLAYAAHKNPNAAIGLSGVLLDYDEYGNLRNGRYNSCLKCLPDNEINATIIEGFAGIAYRRKFFDETIYEISNAPQECINSDDIYISFYLALHNVPRLQLRSSLLYREQINITDMAYTEDALLKTKETQAVRHKICIAYLKQQYPEVVF